MFNDPPGYYAYLIRVWRTGPDGPWRAGMQDARTGEWIGFADVSEACAYLLREVGAGEGASPTDHNGRCGRKLDGRSG